MAAVVAAAAALALGACSSGSATRATSQTTTPPSLSTAALPTTIPPTTVPTTTVPTTTIPPTTTTVAPTTSVAPTTTTAPILQELELGRSVEGRPITAMERGTKGGMVVLVIGCIHGNEEAGKDVVQQLATDPLPAGIDLWLVPTMNPDGEAHHRRTNAHLVDLNRNFPKGWAPLGKPGDEQYAGTGPASEPETAAIVGLIDAVKPSLAVWYHQDLNRIDPGTGRSGAIRRQYAQLTGLPMAPVTGGTYTGTATQWESSAVPNGVAFIVELGPTLDAQQAETHAQAVLTVAQAP